MARDGAGETLRSRNLFVIRAVISMKGSDRLQPFPCQPEWCRLFPALRVNREHLQPRTSVLLTSNVATYLPVIFWGKYKINIR
uniref:Uncharacterized protein n=1 Tax=Anguilla anguilla TaxID=7936 RepID=A0A0E9S5X9_ANGAN